MEGYKDSVISPLSEFNNSMHDIVNYEKGSSSSLKRSRIEASETESTRKERLRRGKMAESFSVLQSMVPSLFPIQKPTREKILTETIEYIGSLEGEAKRLEGLKKSFLEKPVLSSCSYSYLKPSFTASFSNGVAFFGVQLPAKRGLLSKIFRVFEEYHAEILEATVLVNEYQMLTLTGTFAVEGHGANLIEKIKREILVL
ncbi:hypothetical protein ACH5RR_031162 [Cinchona calisaya]|uniref:BHLH domain-containing protein n=1 Tax=Cinchona calisaya TaxID=153742 RepID=A0ABD2YIQ4_9GENT